MSRHSKLQHVLALVVLASIVLSGSALAQPIPPSSPVEGAPPQNARLPHAMQQASGPQQVIIELEDAPAAQIYVNALQGTGNMPTPDAVAASQNQIQKDDQAQKALLGSLTGLGAQVIYRVQRVYNGIAVMVDASKLDQIAKLPGVKAVHPLVPKYIDNAGSVPLIGAPQLWNPSGHNTTGTNMRIGIIDTGIDYLHADFGGQGGADPALYTQNDTTVVGDVPGFPSAKVAGGWDFVGDAYTGTNLPHPDPDPMDCNGHGSHVAGTAAGYGVLNDGATYTGPYDSSLNFIGDFRIGPGVAPNARLYGLRVFGCTGSTSVVTPALDWAIDPNGDGDFSDHLDVVNMSLGSDYAPSYDADSVSSNLASAVGVIVVASAGNAGDAYYVTGTPASANYVISAASSVDALDVMDGFKVDPPSPIAGTYGGEKSVAYNWASLTVISGTLAYPPGNRSGCATFTGADAAAINGKIALLDWTYTPTGGNECGSVARVTNAANAGAKGVILVDPNALPFNFGITGSPLIPAIMTYKSVGDTLKAHVNDNPPPVVEFRQDLLNNIKVLSPQFVDTASSFTSRGPRNNDSALKPDISAPGTSIFSAAYRTGNQGVSESGTSMAAPHITGSMALLKQLHPTWSVAQLKALAMNTANHDLRTSAPLTSTVESPSRVGAGRIDLVQAADSSVIAYNATSPELVSVSFGSVEVLGTASLTKQITVANLGGGTATYNVTYNPTLSTPGVTISVSPGQVTVAPGATATVNVTLDATAASMKHTIDPAAAPSTPANPRNWVAEAQGLVMLSPSASGGPGLRVPVYATARPASAMSGELNPVEVSPTVTVTLTGTPVMTGSNPPLDEISAVMPFELQVLRDKDPTFGAVTRYMAVRAVGVTSDFLQVGKPVSTTLYFGVTNWGQWTAPTPPNMDYELNIDINNDGTADYVVIPWNLADITGQNYPNDVFVAAVIRTSDNRIIAFNYLNGIPANQFDTVPFNNDSMVLPVSAADIGLPNGGNTAIHYWINSFNPDGGALIDSTPVKSYDFTTPGLSFPTPSNLFTGAAAYQDAPGVSFQVKYNAGRYFVDKTLGIMLLHTHNQAGKHLEVLPFGPGMRILYLPLIRR